MATSTRTAATPAQVPKAPSTPAPQPARAPEHEGGTVVVNGRRRERRSLHGDVHEGDKVAVSADGPVSQSSARAVHPALRYSSCRITLSAS